jgi:hypothetical protein
MPIKYGDLTIIYNKEETTLFTSLLLWLEYEAKPPNKSKYVFLFDDGEICDSDDKFKDLKYKFLTSVSSEMPIYFEKTKENKENKENKEKYNRQIFFYKAPIEDKNNNKLTINFSNLFSLYSKYSFDIIIPSIYNSIYYCYKDLTKPEIFGIIRIKSNEYMPRFLFAYDSDEFTKEEIVYLIYYIFNPEYSQNESKNTNM